MGPAQVKLPNVTSNRKYTCFPITKPKVPSKPSIEIVNKMILINLSQKAFDRFFLFDTLIHLQASLLIMVDEL